MPPPPPVLPGHFAVLAGGLLAGPLLLCSQRVNPYLAFPACAPPTTDRPKLAKSIWLATGIAPWLPLPRTREDGVEQATLARRSTDEPRLNDDEVKLLAQIASGVTADVAARKLELSARTLRRRLRTICDRLEVNT